MTGSEVGERGGRIRKGSPFESGFELGMLVAQRLCMYTAHKAINANTVFFSSRLMLFYE